MSKQRYEAPAVKRVRLVVKHAILSVCHSSPNLDPKGATPCTVTAGCNIPPTP
ncbi:MAG: hypothetical protein GXY76_22085 [Chloroflexi bacterium]|nr:hypothetical protein [Chloroflexota bacterium]